MTFSGTADTANIVNDLNLFYFVDLTNPTVQIGAGPAVMLTGNIEASDNPGNPSAEFGEYGPQDLLILGTMNPAFATYFLDTSITESGTAGFNPGASFGVVGGDFILNTTSGDSTFSAVVASTPEPSSILLLATGLAGIAITALRRFSLS